MYLTILCNLFIICSIKKVFSPVHICTNGLSLPNTVFASTKNISWLSVFNVNHFMFYRNIKHQAVCKMRRGPAPHGIPLEVCSCRFPPWCKKRECYYITLSFSWTFSFLKQAFLLIDNVVSCVQVHIYLNVLSTFVWWFDPPPLSLF